tara:strand:- start:31216 stop:32115 length:900 start_codon:yes stop_codon:yes gene_type:complete
MKIGFIGCVLSSKVALEALLENNHNYEVVAVITKKKSNFNSDFVDLGSICSKNNLPIHYEDSKNKRESIRFMKKYNPDVIYCIGWSYLLTKEFLEICKHGVVGFHPASLPKNRGRHPIIWSLCLGLEETSSTLFMMEEGADTGPIINQKNIKISKNDNAKSLYEKILKKLKIQIQSSALDFFKDTVKKNKQDHTKSNIWRKRSFSDGQIDWRMSANDINNLIRALYKPYPGAHFVFKEKHITVFESKVSKRKQKKNIEPGKVLDVNSLENSFLIKCGSNTAIWIYNDEPLKHIKIGDYL